jgi:hypothetical protein
MGCGTKTVHYKFRHGCLYRPSSPHFYTLQINGHFGREIMDAELEAAGLIPPPPAGGATGAAPAEPAGAPSSGGAPLRGGPAGPVAGGQGGDAGAWTPPPPRHPAAAATRILMGHSMGAACCVAEAIDHPEVGDGE